MDLQALHTFAILAEVGSFSQAAERLYLTQPAVSKRIAALEQELGMRLFDRIARQVQLTEAGNILQRRSQNILKEIDDCKREIANLSGTISGQLTIATSHHIGLHHLPKILRKYAKLYQQVDVDLHFMDSEQANQMVANGQMELGIVTLPARPFKNIQATPLWEDELEIVFCRTHPLMKLLTREKHDDLIGNLSDNTQKNQALLRVLQEHPVILPNVGTYTRDLIEQWFAKIKLTPLRGMSTNYLETIKMLVSVGLGWSILPKTMLTSDLYSISDTNYTLSRTLGVVQHESRTLSNASKALLSLLEPS